MSAARREARLPRGPVQTGRVAAVAAAVAMAVAPSTARADDDGAYGRLDGDLLVVAEAGAAIAPGGPSLALGARVLYLSTAGVYARFTEGFGNDDLSAARTWGGGVELRPLFLARFARNMEHGPARLDLLADSLAIDVGAFWWSPADAGARSFPGLEVALGLELPILASADGPHLGAMGSLRVSHGGAGAPVQENIGSRSSALLFTLSWHAILDVGIVDAGDALHR